MIIKEIKNIGYGYLVTEIALFAAVTVLCRSDLSAYLPGFMEITITLITTVFCAFSVYDIGDIELLTSYPTSLFQIVAQRCIIILGSLFLLAAVQVGIIFRIANNTGDILHLLGFVPTALLMSGFTVFTTAIFQNAYGGLTLALLLFPVEYLCGSQLSLHKLPDWYEYFSIFDTTFMSGSPLWLTNRILLVCVSVVLWLLIFILLRNKKWQFVNE